MYVEIVLYDLKLLLEVDKVRSFGFVDLEHALQGAVEGFGVESEDLVETRVEFLEVDGPFPVVIAVVSGEKEGEREEYHAECEDVGLEGVVCGSAVVVGECLKRGVYARKVPS